MARPLRILYPGAFYHVMCRGNKRQNIFWDDDDRRWFLKMLCESLEIYQVVLYCYILMNNHFHMIVQTLRANLSEFMRRFNISYTGWFNYHHHTYGHLYQGRYKAILIDVDNYLLEVSRYVHLNPVRGNKFGKWDYCDQLDYSKHYNWSTLPGYLDRKKMLDCIDYKMILNMIGGRRSYQKFLLDGLKDGLEDIFKDVHHQTILGDDNFVERVKREYLEPGSLREQPEYRDIMMRNVDPEIIIECVINVLGVSIDVVRTRRGDGIIRGMISDILYRYSGMTQRKIGKYLGVDYSAVNKLQSRLRKHLAQDTTLAKQYQQILDAIKKGMSNV